MNLSRRPLSAHLQAWGRAETGWWGCITWFQRVLVGDIEGEIPVSAWVPAAILSLTGWTSSGGENLPRVRLGPDSRQWPAPAGGPAWHAGAWLDGDLPLPPGLTVDDQPAWRRRRRR